nr:Glycosyl hydrolases family 38 C-terminal domain protein [uncultured bacterium]
MMVSETMPREAARGRELRGKLLALERLAATQDWPRSKQQEADFPLARKIAPHIDQAYEQLMLFGEHTWGLDVKSTIKRVFGEGFREARQSEPYTRLEESWRAKAAYVDRAEAAFERALEVLAESARQINPRATSGEARVGGLGVGGGYGDYFADAHQLRGGTPLAEVGQQNAIENTYLRVEVDPASGGIVSLVDKRTGREWVDKTSNEPFGGYRYDIYSAGDIAEFMRAYGLFFQDWFVQDFGKAGYPEDSTHITAYARDFEVKKSRLGDVQTLCLSGGKVTTSDSGYVALPEQVVSIRLSLADDSPYLDIEYNIEGREATPLAESTVVPFPLNLPKASFRLGQVGSVIDPARDIAAGANRNLWCADWIDASDDRVGMAVMPVDMPLVSVGNTGIYRFEPERVPTESVIYAHLWNTQWGTNFPQWLEGDFSFRIRLVPHIGDWRHVNVWLYKPGADNSFLSTWGQTADAKQLPLAIEQDMQVLAVRPKHDGQGMIVRLWDRLGIHRLAKMKIGGPIAKVWRCDLMERPIEQMELHSETAEGIDVVFEIKPHAIETMLIEFTQEGGGAG